MLDAATLVAIVAATVAALSALYARWQALAARQANRISLHDTRLKIYRGLLRLRSGFISSRTLMPSGTVEEFEQHVDLSEFYFPPEIHDKLIKVLEDAMNARFAANQLAQEVDVKDWRTIHDHAGYQALRQEALARCNLVREDIRSLLRLEA